MSLASLIRAMAAAGSPPEAIALAVEAVEAAEGKLTAHREAARDRKRRQRARDDVTVTGQSRDKGVTVTAEPPPPSSSPPNPPNTNPCPRSVISRGDAKAREDAAFTTFWTAYPRKVSKADARKAFARAWRKLPPFDEEAIIVGGLERAKAAWVDAQFIPHAATWLNGERWNDEPDPLPPSSPPNGQRPRPDPRKDAYLDRLADVAAAMDAGLQQPRGGH